MILFFNKCDTQMETNIVFNRKNELDKEGKGLVEIQIYLSRTKRPCRSTGVRVNPKFWDSKKNCVKKSHENSDFLNRQIFNFKLEIEKNLLLDQIDFLRNNKSKIEISNKKPNLLELIDLYVLELKERNAISAGTLKNHSVKRNNLIEYEKFCNRTFTHENFTPVEAEKYKDWFSKTRKTTNVTTSNRNVLFYKQVFQFAVKKGLIDNFPLFNFKGEKDAIKPAIYLTSDEFERVLNQEFHSKMLIQCKDLYLFQCSTGLSFGDLWSDFQVVELETGKAITGNRTKNGQAFFIPLHDLAFAILERYNFKLPIYCNVVYNRILKEIAAICGIKKPLTTHTGRKTFATLADNDGWSRESIALMLGHRSVKTTELYYIGQSFTRIENEMLLRAGKVKND